MANQYLAVEVLKLQKLDLITLLAAPGQSIFLLYSLLYEPQKLQFSFLFFSSAAHAKSALLAVAS